VNPPGKKADPLTPELPIALAPHEFDQIRQLAYRSFGLDLKSGKEELVCARLRKLVRDGGFQSFDGYYRSVLADTTGESLAAMIDALATNHTSFLREPDHFDFLRRDVLPALASRRSVEAWSAACSTGEEVWTLAIVLSDALGGRSHLVTGTDISKRALAFAERAIYPRERCQGLPAEWLARHFVAQGRPPEAWRISPTLRSSANFRRVNLVESYPWRQQYPVIFCRNVMIYFDQPTQERVIAQLSDCLEPGGYLFVGHAESLSRVSHKLEYVRPAVYRKPAAKLGKWKGASPCPAGKLGY
jgi:chemotaxis protein methyltransferase CheR